MPTGGIYGSSDRPLSCSSRDARASRTRLCGDEAWIELASPLKVELRSLASAEAAVREGAVEVADGFGSQGDACTKRVDRLGVVIAKESASASIELRPQASGLQDDGTVKCFGGQFQVAAAQEGASHGVTFPRGTRAGAGERAPPGSRWPMASAWKRLSSDSTEDGPQTASASARIRSASRCVPDAR